MKLQWWIGYVLRDENEENGHKPFGGKVIVLGAHFRQILFVVNNG